MPRKKETVIVPQWGMRDDGKVFLLEEMPCIQGEKWALRMFLVVKGTTAEVPPEVAQLGMVGVAIRGLNSFLHADIRFPDLEPLLDEMMEQVKIVRDPAHHPDVASRLMDDDVEEVETRAWLRLEVLSLHVGFSVLDALLKLFSPLTNPPPPDS